MADNRLKILEGFSNGFILSVIYKADLGRIKITNSESLEELIVLFKNDMARMTVSQIEYYDYTTFPDEDIPEDLVGFVMTGFIKAKESLTLKTHKSAHPFDTKPNEKVFFTIRGSIKFDKLTSKEVEVSNSPDSITLIARMLSTDKEMVMIPFNSVVSKVDAVKKALAPEEDEEESVVVEVEQLEEKADMSKDEYVEWIGKVVELAGHKPTRVWSEYNQVARLTKEPVLMNKAVAIPLTKEQVVGLVRRLSKEYAPQLKAIKRGKFQQHLSATKGIMPVRFGVTTRGHASLKDFEINLPKLGDWRFGYTGMYSAELVFHEFSHVVDMGRKMSQEYGAKAKITGRSDVHRHDFVHILDNMLKKNADWINSKYSQAKHKEQILSLDQKIAYFYANKKKIVSDIAKQEKALRDKIASEQQEMETESGITENEFPLGLILTDDRDVKVGYILWAVEQFDKSKSVQEDKTSARKLGKKIKEDSNVVLTKDEVTILKKVVDSVSRSKFINTLPIGDQLNAMPPIKKFEVDLVEFQKGKLVQAKRPVPLVVIEDYKDFKIIPDDDRGQILG